MILNLIRIKVAPSDRNDAVKTIRRLIGPTKVKPGCESCNLYANTENDDDILLIEKWSTQDQFEKQITSKHYLLLLEALELAKHTPEIEFHTISSTSGLELVERLRQ